MDNFTDTGLREDILKAVQELGFEKPTPIQAKTIPHLLSTNQDLIALAQTGTGKTAAFGLPAIHLVDVDNKATQVLVLCPTRELCLQITKDLGDYSKFTKGLNIVAVYGGSSIDTQIRALKRGAQIVVGTPGRTKDLINRRKLILGEVTKLILDEADEMLTMGFKDDLEAIMSETPDEKQTLLFSATMSREIISVSRNYMDKPIEMSVAKVNIGAENVEHLYYMVHARDRYKVLKRLADLNPNVYGIVFCRTRRETKEVADKLMQDGYNADAIHGDLSQAQRDDVMGKFRENQLQILVATDVAARGLDVKDLTHVINFNLPDSSETYTHRSGRTGRAGKDGISIAIIHSREMGKLRDIERISGVKFSRAQVPTGKEICQAQLYALIDKVVKVEVNEQQIEPFLPEIYKKFEELDREALIKHFVSTEFNQFLSYYKNARDLNVAERKGREDRGRDRGDRKSRGRDRDRGDKGNFARFFINLGSNNSLNPTRLIGLINESLGFGYAEIGKIEILKKFSFFEIDKKLQDDLLKSVKGKEFEGVKVSIEPSQAKGTRSRREFPKRDRRSSGGRPNKFKSDKYKGDRKKDRRY